jgi:hypothetical protein
MYNLIRGIGMAKKKKYKLKLWFKVLFPKNEMFYITLFKLKNVI